ncbi:uncharacterized protein LOC132168176 isoform X1 [Corylus avellana]|uniref:uncharacterized protein LOC132168176 isoform X1 n=2 Tax=Corylus avellana TaxID=13451 RepID=UPI00286BCEC7|nr:uncharacterized protein LOC132168176 isoform X1 [Corylus avellana]
MSLIILSHVSYILLGSYYKMNRRKKDFGIGDNESEFYDGKMKKNEQSMSSASITSSVKEDMEPVQCRCGLRSPIITSTTIKNPGRRFYGCAMYDRKKKAGQCPFFQWYDKETCARGREVLPALYKQVHSLKCEVSLLRGKLKIQTYLLVFLLVICVLLICLRLMGH